MKKKYKILGLAALFLAPLIAYAVNETRIGYDKVTIGNSTAVNKEQRFNINLGAANPGLRGNTATSKIEFSHDGSTWKAIGSGGGAGGGGVVLNENFGFEDGTTGWTASGGTFTVTSTAANVGFGTQAGSWDASAASQTLSYSALTIPAGLYGKICSVSWYYKGGDANLKVQVYDGTNVIAESSALSTQSIYSAKQALYFTCPSSGTITPRLIASANAALVYVDDFKIGQESLFDVNEAGFYGGLLYPGTANCDWQNTGGASFSSFSADTDCATPTVRGNASAPGTKIPAVTFASLPPGDYLVMLSYSIGGSGSPSQCSFRITDGTNNSPSQGSLAIRQGITQVAEFSYITAQSNITFQAQSYRVGGSSCDINNNNAGQDLEFLVYRKSSNPVQAITIDKTGWRIDAKIGGANPSLPGTAVSTYTEITDSGLDMVLASGSASAEIPCSSTNPSTGLTCSAGSESVGISFTPPTAGTYEVCGYFGHEGNGGSSGSIETNFQFIETPNNAQTFTQLGGTITTSGIDLGSGTAGGGLKQNHANCGVFNFADTSKRTIRLMYEQRTFNTIFTNRILGDRDANQGQRDIKISVRRRVEFQDAVKFTNLVTTGRQLGLKTEILRFSGASDGSDCTSSPCTIHLNSGGFNSVTRSGTGVYTVNFIGGTWSQAPACVAYGYGSGVPRLLTTTGAITTSAFGISVRDPSNPVDTGAMIICTGW